MYFELLSKEVPIPVHLDYLGIIYLLYTLLVVLGFRLGQKVGQLSLLIILLFLNLSEVMTLIIVPMLRLVR